MHCVDLHAKVRVRIKEYTLDKKTQEFRENVHLTGNDGRASHFIGITTQRACI